MPPLMLDDQVRRAGAVKLEAALLLETGQVCAARMEEARRLSWEARFARIDALTQETRHARS